MCIIILDNRVGHKDRLDKAVLERAAEVNPNGMGIMYAQDGKLHTWKSLTDFDGLLDRYNFARDNKLKVAMHFRLITLGEITEINCQPFDVHPGVLSMMHNGTFDFLKSKLDKKSLQSDSHVMAEQVFRLFPDGFLTDPIFRRVVDQLVDKSRLLFMDNEGEHLILNASGGAWGQGCWFSKLDTKEYILTGKKPEKSIYHGYQSVHYGNAWGWEGDVSGGQCDNKNDSKKSATQKAKEKWDKKSGDTYVKSGNEKSDSGASRAEFSFDDAAPLIFDYCGMIDPDDVGNFADCGSGFMLDARLHAYQYKGATADAPLFAGASEAPKGYRVFGRIYAVIGADAWDTLQEYEELTSYSDDPSDALFYRTQKQVLFMGSDVAASADVYMCTANPKYVDQVYAIPFGDWRRFEDDVQGVVPTVKAKAVAKKSKKKAQSKKAVALKDGDQCPSCQSENTQLFDVVEYSKGSKAEYTRLWCCRCDKSFGPVTQKEIT